ncbi:indolepyruvate ferredoxin oxidoreductase [Sinobacterium caligoides]|uniref:Indolepyruvate ferredoxin oxidoreductase n=1 Tax=Sinobacterium caligoides TaxID=933926 RepID=A0A3N2DZ71_9GAMM|nr:indolepyruvate ferredoxin oxidoreductase family protein [Sinobacterium caligoides]ROS05067.1 indolepyruvate ferredoxin oxidoreductase [Sinobacterium caligoides]
MTNKIRSISASPTESTLSDKFQQHGTVLLSGIEALARLALLQAELDQQHGIDSAGFISGYRGSPIGGLDQVLWKQQTLLEQHRIYFQPGLNEDLAATAVWGSQQAGIIGEAKYQGVFALWYGKGPGVDRSMDAIKHANAAGTAAYGGVLALAGDDHGARSSTLPHQSEHLFIAAGIPVLNPAGIEELIDFGLYGWAMSRYSGCWVALKAITENMDSRANIDIDLSRINIVNPDLELPADGLHLRWPDTPVEQEFRLQRHKIYAARAFCLANQLDRIVVDPPNARLGIITTGKAYHDVRQALLDLGIDGDQQEHSIRLLKIGMSWPLEPNIVHRFAKGLREILVVEEKRSIIEDQLTGQLYNWPVDERPTVVGEFDEQQQLLLGNTGELDPAIVATVIAARLAPFYQSAAIEQRVQFLQQQYQALQQAHFSLIRKPHYCSGCPHNSSTVVPEGSHAMAGIGCHYMATWMGRDTLTFTQMGGEGVTWIGQARFTQCDHVFQNLGDGTYLHSGSLAIRAALAAKVNITYKILFNDAVAMTGGQPLDGSLNVPQLSQQLYSEGVKVIALVTDAPHQYDKSADFAPVVEIFHRRELDNLQRRLRQTKGVSCLIFDQTCAAEKRRRRKRGAYPDVAKRLFINRELCEGCGDCSTASNCLSIVPVETTLGRKREIDQEGCNKDYSCLEGFCPSFVSLEGARLKRQVRDLSGFPPPDEVGAIDCREGYNIVLTGIGGTGIVTASALLSMAAHLEGKITKSIDITGLAQKFGAVTSHVRIAERPHQLFTARIPAGCSHLLLGFDLAVSSMDESLALLDKHSSFGIINEHQSITADFIHDVQHPFPKPPLLNNLYRLLGDKISCFNPYRLSQEWLGSPRYCNTVLLGHAYQLGKLPVSASSLQQAIRLNQTDQEENLLAFTLGRLSVTVSEHLRQKIATHAAPPDTLAECLESYCQRLTNYHNARYARRFQQRIERLSAIELATHSHDYLAIAAAHSYYKLLACKDEFEVARQLTSSAFTEQLDKTFSGDFSIHYHLAAPYLRHHHKRHHSGNNSTDNNTDHNTDNNTTGVKRHFGGYFRLPLRLLAKLRWLRFTPLNPFRLQADRRLEQQTLTDFEADCQLIEQHLQARNVDIALELLQLPLEYRGYGHIKHANITRLSAQREQLRGQLSTIIQTDKESSRQSSRPLK